jgi:hypothetical protein
MTEDTIDEILVAIQPFVRLADVAKDLEGLRDLQSLVSSGERELDRLKKECREATAKRDAIRAEIKSTEGKVAEQIALAQRSVEDLWEKTRADVDNYIRDRRAMADAKHTEAERAVEAAKAIVADAAAKLGGR